MKTWEARIIYDQDDVYDTDIDAETIEDAARLVWDEWHPTGWHEAVITGDGDWLSIDLDQDEPNFSRSL